MASRFQVPDRDQVFMTAMSFREAVGDDHLVWTVIEVVDALDMSEAYARYDGDPRVGGRPAFDPRMLLSLLIMGYREGKRSSRELEEACGRDWVYRTICGGLVPDHATIARFRQRHDDLIPGWFAEVLAICVEAGLVDVETVAVDGTKMRAAASKGSNRTAETLERLEAEARVMLDEAADADTHSDPGSGGGLRSSESRRETERVRRSERIRAARRVVAEAESKRMTEEKKRGKPKRPVANTTDPDSRVMKTHDGGWMQGFNAQAVTTADQVVIAAVVTSDPTDVGWFEPMFVAARANLDAAGISQPIGVGLADAGYWSAANAVAAAGLADDMLIATTKTHQVGTITVDDETIARDQTRINVIERVIANDITVKDAAAHFGLSPGRMSKLVSRYRNADTLESPETVIRHQMETKLADPANRDRYRQRGWLIEGCFAHVKVHRHSPEFLRRGLAAVNAEWQLMHLAGNIDKLHRHRLNGGTPPSDGPSTPQEPPRHVSRDVLTAPPHPHRPHSRQIRPHTPRRQRALLSPNPVKRRLLSGGETVTPFPPP